MPSARHWQNTMAVEHPFPPLYGPASRYLILGSFPSVKSREACFFYGHPQNRFWKVMAALCNQELPKTVEEKTSLILDNGFALWDVIASCEIQGSADSSIRDALPNDLGPILQSSKIQKIFCNGTTAHKLYLRYLYPKTQIPAVCLPSTSPANAAWSLERLIARWEAEIFEEE